MLVYSESADLFFDTEINSDIPGDARPASAEEHAVRIAKGKTVDMPAGAPPVAARTFKADVWRRTTDEEAEALDAALRAATAKLRRLWEDSTILEHDAPEWGTLWAGVAAVVGEERAAQLLAPSEM